MINKGFGMLITAVLCFIDQRIASLLYHNFKDKLHIHKRCFAKLFCTTIKIIEFIFFFLQEKRVLLYRRPVRLRWAAIARTVNLPVN